MNKTFKEACRICQAKLICGPFKDDCAPERCDRAMEALENCRSRPIAFYIKIQQDNKGYTQQPAKTLKEWDKTRTQLNPAAKWYDDGGESNG